MDIGINLDPISAVDSILDISGNQRRADQQVAKSDAQNLLDNQRWRENQNFLYRQYFEGQKREDSRLQRLVTDAQKAGISPLAALGAGGYSPITVNMPAAQGGRVSGTYMRKTLPQMTASVNTQMRDYLSTELMKEEIFQARGRTFLQNIEMNKAMIDYRNYLRTGGAQLLYTPVVDNTEQARQWYQQEGMTVVNNPALNLDVNESIGTLYHAAPRFNP